MVGYFELVKSSCISFVVSSGSGASYESMLSITNFLGCNLKQALLFKTYIIQ